MTPRFEVLNHTADMALRVFGHDLRELFGNAAYAMFAQMADLDQVPVETERRVAVGGMDDEALLVNWLNELIYLHETQGEIYSVFAIEELANGRLRATVRGSNRMRAEMSVKAATFHNLYIEKTATGFETAIVFDV